MANIQQAINDLYTAQKKNKISEINNARIAAENNLRAGIPSINQQYDTANSQAVNLARANSLAGNEKLASLGLAGGLNQNPTSGYSETSRIAERNNLNSQIGLNNRAKAQALNNLDRQIQNSNLNFAMQKASSLGNIDAARGQATVNQMNSDRSFNENVRQADRSYNFNAQKAKQDQANWQTQYNYQKGRDTVNDQRYTQSRQDQKDAFDAQQKAYTAKLYSEEVNEAVNFIQGNTSIVKSDQNGLITYDWPKLAQSLKAQNLTHDQIASAYSKLGLPSSAVPPEYTSKPPVTGQRDGNLVYINDSVYIFKNRDWVKY